MIVHCCIFHFLQTCRNQHCKKKKSHKQQVTTIKPYTAPAENPKCLWQDNVILLLKVILNVLFTGVNNSLLVVVVGGKET